MSDSTQGEGAGDRRPMVRLREAAQRVRTRLRHLAARLRDDTPLLFVVIFINCAVIVGAASLWAWLGSGTATAASAGGVMLLFVGAMLPLVRSSGEERSWPPAILLAVPAAIVLIGVISLGVWLYVTNKPLDVTNQVRLEDGQGMTNGDTATVSLHTGDPRPRLRITFRAVDHRPDLPACVPNSELEVTPTGGSGERDRRKVTPGEPLEIDLGPGLRDIKLDVRLLTETECELNLSVTRATLDK